jgi:hypothetical protein
MRWRYACTTALSVAALTTGATSDGVDTKTAVRLAREYLAAWEQSLAAVVAEERYTQTVHEWPLGRHVVTHQNTKTERALVSDVLLVHAPRDQAWLLFRDVLFVDGAPVQDRQRRFDDLFSRPDANLVTSARRIADESARFNVGRVHRNLNTPVATLAFLDRRYEAGVRWRNVKPASVDGVSAWQLSFEQKRPPFVIRNPEGKPQPSQGHLWLEAGSGRILKTELEVSAPIVSMSPRGRPVVARTWSRVVSHFGPMAGLNIWVPVQMIDEYQIYARFEERMVGEAIYTNHRVFQTSAASSGTDANSNQISSGHHYVTCRILSCSAHCLSAATLSCTRLRVDPQWRRSCNVFSRQPETVSRG